MMQCFVNPWNLVEVQTAHVHVHLPWVSSHPSTAPITCQPTKFKALLGVSCHSSPCNTPPPLAALYYSRPTQVFPSQHQEASFAELHAGVGAPKTDFVHNNDPLFQISVISFSNGFCVEEKCKYFWQVADLILSEQHSLQTSYIDLQKFPLSQLSNNSPINHFSI